MGDFTITDALQHAFDAQQVDCLRLREATPEEFYSALRDAKVQNVHGAFVTLHSVDEYRQMAHLLLTLDNTAGVAITKDNNIVSVFNGGEKRGVLKTLLPIAIENGGRKLDNYGSGKLSAMYELYGFNPISQTPFDSKFAPDDWNYDRDGTPAVVFWIHNGDSAADVVLNFGTYQVNWKYVQEFRTYDEAEAYRDQIDREIEAME
mgnify:CR=1 FL=1